MPVQRIWQAWCPNEECGWHEDWISKLDATRAYQRHKKDGCSTAGVPDGR